MRLGILSSQVRDCRPDVGQLDTTMRQARESVNAALALLYRAFQYSVHTSSNRWQFAVEIEELLSVGITRSDLRWLVVADMVSHAAEVHEPMSQTRRFEVLGTRPFLRNSCFVLSDHAIMMISQQFRARPRRSIRLTIAAPSGLLPPTVQNGASAQQFVPQWHSERRELRLRGQLIKQFRGPAANQEWIIRAFHEEQWAARIDDPLPPIADRDSQRRLNDAIKNLNRHQAHPLISFHGDGTGRGILWELRDPALVLPTCELP
jgi:hypothetical protein